MKIKDITKKKWQDKDFWEVELEDGTKGSCWNPEFANYQIGQDVDFDIQKDAKNNNRFKMKTANKGGGGGRGKSPEELAQQQRTMVLAYAKDLTVGVIGMPGTPETMSAEEVIALWKKFFDEGMKIAKG
jgi:hypothetical protein